jgi:hypothetical protein
MERDERLMAILGTRLLETQKREAETAEALQLRHAGEESILSTLALSVSDSLTRVLRIVSWWIPTATLEDSPDALDQSISLNTDFGIKGLTAQELQSIVAVAGRRDQPGHHVRTLPQRRNPPRRPLQLRRTFSTT